VILTPIVAMGWGRDAGGGWSNRIAFRVREYDPIVEKQLRGAVAKGRQFEVPLLNGEKEAVYCESGDLPAWVREPDGRIRVFRYHRSGEINDFAHQYYTRLGVNIMYYGLMGRR
jgi:hypothetical protein